MTRSWLALAIVAGLVYLGAAVSRIDAAELEAAEVVDLTWEQLKFDGPAKDKPFERTMLGKDIEKLDGKQVRIRGYMLPAYESEMSKIVLMRDNREMSFGYLSPLHETILVEMTAGKKAQYTSLPISVTGKFEIREFRNDEGVVGAVYHIDADSAGRPQEGKAKQP